MTAAGWRSVGYLTAGLLNAARLLALGLLLHSAGCSWIMVSSHPERESGAGPCEASYTWPMADAGLAGIGIPATTVGTIVALQTACPTGSACARNADAFSIGAVVVGITAVVLYLGSHHAGMNRVTRCRLAGIRQRFSASEMARRAKERAAPRYAPAAAPATALAAQEGVPDPGRSSVGSAGQATAAAPPAQDPTLWPQGSGYAAQPGAHAAGPAYPEEGAGAPGGEFVPPGDEGYATAPPSTAAASTAGMAPREVVFHDKALDELSRMTAEEQRQIRARARQLALRPFDPAASPMGAPWQGHFVLPVPETGRGIIYRVADTVLVVEALMPLAALDLNAGAAAQASPSSAAPPSAPPLPGGAAPPPPPQATDAEGFIPPP